MSDNDAIGATRPPRHTQIPAGHVASSGPNFVTLWVIVSGLWTIATGLRILRIWVPEVSWPGVVFSTFTWAGLLVPPLVFAIILAAMNRIAAGHHPPSQ
jgi:hypothetical protein